MKYGIFDKEWILLYWLFISLNIIFYLKLLINITTNLFLLISYFILLVYIGRYFFFGMNGMPYRDKWRKSTISNTFFSFLLHISYKLIMTCQNPRLVFLFYWAFFLFLWKFYFNKHSNKVALNGYPRWLLTNAPM